MIDIVVADRRAVSTIQSDPVLFRLLAEHPPSLDLWVRLFRTLLDGADDDRALGAVASVLSATIGCRRLPVRDRPRRRHAPPRGAAAVRRSRSSLHVSGSGAIERSIIPGAASPSHV